MRVAWQPGQPGMFRLPRRLPTELIPSPLRFTLDVAGAWQTTSTTCTYTVVAIGRVTLNGTNCGATPPIPYMNAMNSAFVLGTNPAAELGAFEPQSAGLSNASLAGTYYVGTSEIVSQDAQAEVENSDADHPMAF